MRREEDLKVIIAELSRLESEVRLRVHLSFVDLNIASENFFRDLFNRSFGWNLANMNFAEQNIDSIDLGDDTNKFAVQVTSTVTTAKVKKTLKSFVANSRHGRFPKLIFLFLAPIGKKQFNHSVENAPACEFWDSGEFVRQLNDQDGSRIAAAADYVREQLGHRDHSRRLFLERFASNAARHISTVADRIVANKEATTAELGLDSVALKAKFQKMKCSDAYRKQFDERAGFFPEINRLRQNDGFAGGEATIEAIAALIRNIYFAILGECSTGDEVHSKISGHLTRAESSIEETYATEILISYLINECGIFNDEK